MFTPSGFSPAHALPAAVAGDAYAFAFRGDQVLVRTSDAQALVMPRHGELDSAGVTGTPHFMGLLGERACVAIDLRDDVPEPAGMRFVGLRALFFKVPDELLALAARAFQIVDFDRNHRFCGHCGTPVHGRGHERAKECPACGLVAYPRISPAMMVLVTRGRDLLLARKDAGTRLTRADAEAIQLDEQSETMRRTAAAMRAGLPADLAKALEGWDGKADAGSPRYLVARALRRAARERALAAWGAPPLRWGLEGDNWNDLLEADDAAFRAREAAAYARLDADCEGWTRRETFLCAGDAA